MAGSPSKGSQSKALELLAERRKVRQTGPDEPPASSSEPSPASMSARQLVNLPGQLEQPQEVWEKYSSYLPPDLKKRFQKYCYANDLEQRVVLRDLIRAWLDRQTQGG